MPPEKMRAQMVHWMLQAELPHRLIYLYLRTDMIVDEDSFSRLGEAGRAGWERAVAEYRSLAAEEDDAGSFFIHEQLAANGTLRSGGRLVPLTGGTPIFEIDGEVASEFAADDVPVLRTITRLLVNRGVWFMVLPKAKEDGLWGLLVQKTSAPLVENELERYGLYLTRGPHTI